MGLEILEHACKESLNQVEILKSEFGGSFPFELVDQETCIGLEKCSNDGEYEEYQRPILIRAAKDEIRLDD